MFQTRPPTFIFAGTLREKYQSTPQTLPEKFQSIPDRSTGHPASEIEKFCRLYNSFVG
jgi:hypothetical protein